MFKWGWCHSTNYVEKNWVRNITKSRDKHFESFCGEYDDVFAILSACRSWFGQITISDKKKKLYFTSDVFLGRFCLKDLFDETASSWLLGIIASEPSARQGAVYKFNCWDCQATYIGENEDIRLTENNHIAKHYLKTNHRIDRDKPRNLNLQ